MHRITSAAKPALHRAAQLSSRALSASGSIAASSLAPAVAAGSSGLGLPGCARQKSSKAAPGIHPGVTRAHFDKVFNLPAANAAALREQDWKAVWAAEYGDASPAQALAQSRSKLTATGHDSLAFRAVKLRDPSVGAPRTPGSADPMAELVTRVPEEAPAGAHLVDETAYDSHDEEGMPSPMFGDDIASIPRSVMDDMAEGRVVYGDGEGLTSSWMRDDADLREEAGGSAVRPPSPVYATMTPLEQELDKERRRLKSIFMDPAPVTNRPIHDWASVVLDISQTANVTSGGIANSSQALVLVGNHAGGIGYGVGKHADAEKAVQQAIDRGIADAIHVSTYQGQLVHDLVGRKNNVLCIMRSRPPAFDGTASWLLSHVMDFIGVKYYSAKVTGAKHKNPYTVIQAIFNAFNYMNTFEREATKRGLRYVPMGEDRFNPRNRYPQPQRGPNFVGVKYNDRPNMR